MAPRYPLELAVRGAEYFNERKRTEPSIAGSLGQGVGAGMAEGAKRYQEDAYTKMAEDRRLRQQYILQTFKDKIPMRKNADGTFAPLAPQEQTKLIDEMSNGDGSISDPSIVFHYDPKPMDEYQTKALAQEKEFGEKKIALQREENKAQEEYRNKLIGIDREKNKIAEKKIGEADRFDKQKITLSSLNAMHGDLVSRLGDLDKKEEKLLPKDERGRSEIQAYRQLYNAQLKEVTKNIASVASDVGVPISVGDFGIVKEGEGKKQRFKFVDNTKTQQSSLGVLRSDQSAAPKQSGFFVLNSSNPYQMGNNFSGGNPQDPLSGRVDASTSPQVNPRTESYIKTMIERGASRGAIAHYIANVAKEDPKKYGY